MKTKNSLWLMTIAIVLVLGFAITTVVMAKAVSYDDAMEAILADETLNKNKIETVKLDSEGYLDIPVELTYYFDFTKNFSVFIEFYCEFIVFNCN